MILFLTAFFLIFTLICAKNTRYGVYTVIFSMPLYLAKFSIGGIPSTALEMMIYILFLIWVLGRIKKKNFYPALAEGLGGFNRLCKNNFILLAGILLLFLGITISTALSSDIRTSLGIFKGWFVDPFLFFIVFINTIKEKEHILWSLKSWLASGVAISLIGIFYLLSGDITFDGRLHAFFLSPNHLAMYLAPAFLIALFFLLHRRDLDRKVFSIEYLVLSIFLLIIFVPLYLTYSYGAFLGIFAGVVYLFAVGNKNLFFLRGFSRRLRSFSFVSFQKDWRLKPPNPQLKLGRIQILKFLRDKLLKIILLFFVVTSFTFLISNKFNQITNSENRSSFHSRLMIWNTAGEIIKDSPLFGIGPGTFQEAYLSYAGKFDQSYLEWAVPQPHNIFLAFYLQTGLIGFVGFILILIWFFGRRNEALPRSYNIINALMIYILIHGLVDTTYWKNDLSLMFWLLIGLVAVNNIDFYKIKRSSKK